MNSFGYFNNFGYHEKLQLYNVFFYYCEYCTLLSILIHNDNWSYYRQQHSSDNEDEKQEKGVYCKINELLFLP